MDKLRALRYFVTSAKSGSFTRAAGQLGVTVPAVQKLVGQLEQELGVALLVRSSQGLALTAAGTRYLIDVDHMLSELERADTKIRPRKGDLSGLVVVAVPTYLIEAIFEPVFDDFVKRYPRIRLDFRSFDSSQDIARAGVDIYICHGWYAPPDLVRRTLAVSNFITVATPEFWGRHGRPSHPNDLKSLPCLAMRTLTGTLMDLWDYERDGEVIRVPVKCMATFENAQRGSLMRLVMLGHAAFRTSDYLTQQERARSELEVVLSDWRGIGAPPIQMLFRSDARSDPAVDAVLDFVAEQFEDFGDVQHAIPERPDWSKRNLPNASLHLERSVKREK